MATYVTFGQIHTHRINGVTLDCDTVAKVNDREHAFILFGDQFFTNYTEEQITKDMHYYPKGVVDLTKS